MKLKPYRSKSLELSRIVLGGPAGRGVANHERQGVVLLPRPSLNFTTGEIVKAYLDIYGLRRDISAGGSSPDG